MENNTVDLTKRTKGEWIANHFMSESSIYSPTKKVGIAKLKYTDFTYTEEEVMANADFIVKAVNNYDMLLTALKDIFQYDQENTWVGRTALKAIEKAEK